MGAQKQAAGAQKALRKINQLSIVFSDVKILRGPFWSPSVDYSCHNYSFNFTQITGIYMTVGRIVLLLLTIYW